MSRRLGGIPDDIAPAAIQWPRLVSQHPRRVGLCRTHLGAGAL